MSIYGRSRISVLGRWMAALALGAWIYWAASRSARPGELGWLGGPFFGAASGMCWLASPGRSLWSVRRLVWPLILVCGWTALGIRTILAARTLTQIPTRDSVLSYGLCILELLAFVFVWALGFPLRQGAVPEPRRVRLLWRACLILVGILALGIEAQSILRVIRDASAAPLDCSQMLQARLAWGITAAYALLLIRVVLLTTRYRLRHADLFTTGRGATQTAAPSSR
jgi:hypothetical protein